jgi:hypothetical protein
MPVDNTTVLGDSAGTDEFGFIDESVSVGLGIFDHVYGMITGKRPPAAAAPPAAPIPAGNKYLIFGLMAFGAWWLLVRRRY